MTQSSPPPLDAAGQVTAWNTSVERLSGHDRAAVLGQSMALFYPDGQMPAQRLADISSGRRVVLKGAPGDGRQLRPDTHLTALCTHAAVRRNRDSPEGVGIENQHPK